jgi:hypothetical protein
VMKSKVEKMKELCGKKYDVVIKWSGVKEKKIVGEN